MRVNVLTAVTLLLFAFNHAQAETLIGDSQIAFSADRTVVWKDKSYTGKMYASPGKQRHEQTINGLRVTAILRADKNIADLILPDLGLYTALPFPKAVTEYGGISRLGQPVATKTIGGEAATEYHIVSHGSDGSLIDGMIWMTSDMIPVQIDGTYSDQGQPPHHGRLELSNIRRAPQDPALFEVPRGMNQIPPETVESLFSLRMPKLKH